jgi:cation diffusion facilitator family transporter
LNETQIKEKKLAATLSIVSNSFLILLKVFAGIISGSIGIISEAIHSGSDLLASLITYFSVSESSKPADEDHQFGHGKYEDFTSLIEGILIILAAFYIIYEAVQKMFCGKECTINTNVGLVVMFASVVVNILVSAYLFKVAKSTGSAALYADGEHLRTDIYSSMAVFIGLLCVKITGNILFDPIIAVLVAMIIFIAGYKICETAKNSLVDTSLSKEENEKIVEIINANLENGIISLKNLRTRQAGLKKNIEMTLIVEKNMHISTSHKLCDKIEDEIEANLNNTDISIHLEPNG